MQGGGNIRVKARVIGTSPSLTVKGKTIHTQHYRKIISDNNRLKR